MAGRSLRSPCRELSAAKPQQRFGANPLGDTEAWPTPRPPPPRQDDVELEHPARRGRHPAPARLRRLRPRLGPRRLRLDDVRLRAAGDHGLAQPFAVRRPLRRRLQPRRLGLRRRRRRHAGRPLRPGQGPHLRHPRLLGLHRPHRHLAEPRAASSLAHPSRLHLRRRVGRWRRSSRRVRQARAARAHHGHPSEHLRHRLGLLHRRLPDPLRRLQRRSGLALSLPARHPARARRLLHPADHPGPGPDDQRVQEQRSPSRCCSARRSGARRSWPRSSASVARAPTTRSSSSSPPSSSRSAVRPWSAPPPTAGW